MPKKKENTDLVDTQVEEVSKEETPVLATEKPKKTPKEKFVFACKWFFLSYIWLFLVMFILDIVTKNVILSSYASSESGTYPITIIPNFLYVDFTVNSGMAFGINTGNNLANFILFVCISLIGMIVILVIYGIQYKKLTPFVKACLMLLLAGCIGNLIDRSFYTESYFANAGITSNRGVIDWISFKFGNWYFPTFNLADASLVVGAIMLIVWLFVQEGIEDRKKKKEEKAAQDALKAAETADVIDNNNGSSASSETVVESEQTEAPPEVDENKSPAEIENQENGEDSSK